MASRKLFCPLILAQVFLPKHTTSLKLIGSPIIRYHSRRAEEIRPNKEIRVSDAQLDPFAPISQTQSSDYLEELSPSLKRSFNLAAYVNQSKTLQELVKLGVSLYDIENTNNAAARYYLNLDFEKDCVPYVKFLVRSGLKERNLGRFISEFPMIFNQHIDDLQTRLNYFEAMGFSQHLITKALNRSSQILSRPTKFIDFKLGQLQIEFKLPAKILRTMVAVHPEIIGLPEEQYRLVNFVLAEEFGFQTREMHKILERQPQVLDILRPVLLERLDLIHNTIGLSHDTIVEFPKLITGPKMDIKHRSQYLKKLNRDQYDPKQPLYVPPSSLYRASDEEFCHKFAKTTLDDYKLFLRNSC